MDAPIPVRQTDKMKELQERLVSIAIETRARRIPVEREWLLVHAAWMARPVRQQFHSDMFSYYIPQLRRSIERSTTRIKKILTPDPLFEVRPGSETDVQNSLQADAVRAYMYYLNRKRINMKRNITQLARNLLMYTMAVLKTTVEVYDVDGTKEIWPRTRVVDPFQFYIYPETAIDPEDRLIVFEDHMMSWQDYEAKAAEGLVTELKRGELVKPEWPTHHVERLSHQGLSSPSDVRTKLPEDFVSMTEIWFKASNKWLQCWIVWNHMFGPQMVMGPRPSVYGGYPYRDAFARPIFGQTYTHSMGHDTEPLQVWLNDTINQMEEARVISSLPPMGVDKSMVGRKDSLVYRPRAVWDVEQGAISPVPIPDTSTGSLRVFQTAMSLLNSVSGGNPLQEGQTVRNMPRAASGVNNLLSMTMADIEDVADIIETECLEPTVADQYRITKQFVPMSQVIKIPGTRDFPPQQLSSQDLAGDYVFYWNGSIASQNGPQRAQGLMQMATLLMQAAPIMQQQGYKINWADMGRMIWREGLGERGLNDIIQPMSEQEKMQVMMQMAQQQQMMQAQNQQRSTMQGGG